jgi:hypothetical protein
MNSFRARTTPTSNDVHHKENLLMPTRKKSLLVTGGVLIGLTAATLLSGGAAGAASAKSTTPAQPTAAPISGKGAIAVSPHTASAPKGYVIVNSGTFDNPVGAESNATATCPAGTVVWGGGVLDSGFLGQTINGSYPSVPPTAAWTVYVDNAGSTDESFTVYAVCAKKSKKYVIEQASMSVPTGTQAGLTAACPAKTVVLGGGAFSSGIGSAYAINTTYPGNTTHWSSDMNNTGSTETAIDYAICGKKPKGYVIVPGTATDNPPGSDTGTTASCPSSHVSILSAGVYSTSGATDVDVNELNASGGAVAYEANASADDWEVFAYAICAK